jgi:acetolactate decarboxylase
MLKIFLISIISLSLYQTSTPEVKVAGAMKNIMMQGNLKAYADLDTFNKRNLYGLGPIEDLKGEILVLNGEVFTSEKNNNKIVNKQNKVSKAAMFVFSYVENWKTVNVEADINNYDELESLIVATAKQNGYDTTVPFVFKIEANTKTSSYHIIDWKKGVKHTMDNHKQFAYSTKIEESNLILLGFYSDHHHSVFTHHTTNMHLHLLDEKTKHVGHLDNLTLKSTITIYLPAS